MSPDEKQFLDFYNKYRRDEQARWYRNRYTTYERAHRQTVGLASFMLFLSAVASILGTADGDQAWKVLGGYTMPWSLLAAALAAAGTAVAAYRTLYGFQENARLYRDADNALAFAGADSPDDCENCSEAGVRTAAQYALLVEQVFRREQGQWGQLVSQTRAAAGGEQPDSSGDPAPPKGVDQANGGNDGGGEGGDGANPGNGGGNVGGAGDGGAGNGGNAGGGNQGDGGGGVDHAKGQGGEGEGGLHPQGESGTTRETFTAGSGGSGGSGAGTGTGGGGEGGDQPREGGGV